MIKKKLHEIKYIKENHETRFYECRPPEPYSKKKTGLYTQKKTSNLFFIIDYPPIKSTINLFFIIFFLVTLNWIRTGFWLRKTFPLDSQSTNVMVRHHFLIVWEYILQMVKHCALNVVPPYQDHSSLYLPITADYLELPSCVSARWFKRPSFVHLGLEMGFITFHFLINLVCFHINIINPIKIYFYFFF